MMRWERVAVALALSLTGCGGPGPASGLPSTPATGVAAPRRALQIAVAPSAEAVAAEPQRGGAEPQGVATAPEAVGEGAEAEPAAPSRSDEGESAQQAAMLAPKPTKEDWDKIRRWLRARGVAAATEADLGRLAGRREGSVECDRTARLGGGLEVIVCHHVYLREPWESVSDWVLLAPAAGWLSEVFRAPEVIGANDFVEPFRIGVYVRLLLELAGDGRSLRLDEAAPGVCAGAQARARQLRGGEPGGATAAEVVARSVVRMCGARGGYALRDGRFVADPR